jgi:RNA-directed DNA polymerase
MLGWTFRKFNGKLIVKPAKKAIKAFVATLSDTILQRGKAWKQELLIEKLNQKIRGWANYHQSVCASEAFAHIDYILFELLWQWAKRRHPHKGQWWVSTKYWRRKGNRNWVFSTEDGKELLRVDHIPIVRHTRVRMDACPYLEPEYFIQRQFNHGMKRLSGRFKQIWKNQDGCCYHCSLPMDISDEREILFKTPKSEGGTGEASNMAYVHSHCQFLYTERRSKE